MNVGILGLGEVGSAIKKLIGHKHKVFVRELAYDQIGDHQIDILHVCIPYTKSFDSVVKQAIFDLKPNLTIINSTVKPGTTAQLHRQTKANLIHSPFLGVHPKKDKSSFNHPKIGRRRLQIHEFFNSFPKVIGPVNTASYQLAKQHFVKLGLKVRKFDSPYESELAKVLETTYYGWVIIFEKWVHSICARKNINFDQAYTLFNQIYNQGYQKEFPHLRRPIILHHPGPIGGHCVIPNAQILNDYLSDDFTAFLLAQNQKLGKKRLKR